METIFGRSFEPGENVRRDAVSGWDSLKHVELVFAIESALHVQFSAEEMGELDSLERLVSTAERYLCT
jgi:acyl carrier protein